MAETETLQLVQFARKQRNWDTDMNANLAKIDDKTVVARVANDEGSLALAEGMVVKHSTTDEGALQSDTENDIEVVGVVYDTSITPGASGLIVVAGYVAKVLVTGGVSIGDFLTPSSTAGYARTAEWYEVAFARALSNQASGECSAVVFQPRRPDAAAGMVCRFDVGLFDVHLFG